MKTAVIYQPKKIFRRFSQFFRESEVFPRKSQKLKSGKILAIRSIKMSGKSSIFESFPIQLKDGELRTFVLQFKPESAQRIPTRLDYIRASRKLTLDETFGSDILVYPDFNTSQGQVFQSPHFKIIVIFPDDQDFDCIGFDGLADKIGLMLNANIEAPEVDPRVLTQALSFVCETKLSPKWNRINQYLVRFPDFLDRKDIQIGNYHF
mgnify:CR=1 FL=1